MRYVCAGLAIVLLWVLVCPLVALILGCPVADVITAAHDQEVLSATFLSIGCAALSVAAGIFFGVPAGYWLSRSAKRRFWQAFLDLPLVVPHPILGLGLMLVFSRHSLVGAALSEHFGLRVVSATPGIMVAMFVVSAPMIVKAARDGFLHVPQNLEHAAHSLGAKEWRVFFTVSLPLAWRTIRSGALLAWARAVSEFGSVVILAYYPKTAPVMIWDRFSAYGLQAAIAPSIILLAVCLALLLILQWLDER